MAVDLPFITYFAPILAFLIVFILVYAVLHKTKVVGENKWIASFLALVVAALFVAFAGTRDYIITIMPWIAALIVCLVVLLIVMNFAGAPKFMMTGAGIVFSIAVLVIFIVSAFFLFSHTLVQFVPSGATDTGKILNYFFNTRIAGALLLLIIGGIVSWVLIKAK